MEILPTVGTLLMLLAVGSSLLWCFTKLPAGEPLARHVTMAAQIAPMIFLTTAFVFDLEALDLVSRYGGADLPLLYRVSAVWGGRAGPLLLWSALMGVVTWFMSGRNASNSSEVRLMHGMTAAILLVAWILSPFAASSGWGGTLNPLLQTDLMVIHPPVVFAYYSLCLAVASVAVAGLIDGRDARSVHEAQLHWARAGFLLGAVGIGLGGLWAYTVLDWGGYWAWDPVETGSILPWFALLMIVHARARTDSQRDSAIVASPALGMIAGALAIHATLVTRANGVWASVHSFVGNEEARQYDDPYLRIIQLFDDGAAGIEVAVYSLLMISLCIAAVIWLARQQRQSLVNRGAASLLNSNRGQAVVLLLSTAAIGIWIGSTAVTLVGIALMFLLISGEAEKPPTTYVFGGVFLMLFASWSWTATLAQAVVGMLLFLAPWLLSTSEEEAPLSLVFSDTRVRMKLARSIPWFAAAAFLTLTWLLLTAEIDGTSLAAHEFYGAPILAIVILALTVYAWGKTVDARRGNALMLTTLAVSLGLAWSADHFSLPGDPTLMLTDTISRGALAMFLLTWLVIAIPPTAKLTYDTVRKVVPHLSKDGLTAPSNAARLRLFGSHLAHLGIILLLLGHVLTTTLVDRADPSHLITLEKDSAVEFNGYEFTFRETVLLAEDDPDYEYNIGNGFAGFVIEVTRDGEKVDEVTPGILRFGWQTTRSEVDRMVRPSGDLIFILDQQQAQISLTSMMQGETDEVSEIRVTVHDLQGSHLVWTGWGLIMLGGVFALISSDRYRSDEEE
ncbi:MAG: hypothetical protein DBX06_05960 [Candidatus Poseidoniales archaeon]|nr:MAG: hypothetical protein DBX06_06335 [Candidatus Poseidoniales archaeon]RCH71561.1 MAG: hypothetical protein DBX06_05960 [Candidatus Poseidoniales archaeon]|tara:strand:- start:2080 stop:4443 length:2364 start_codon:yes stop_codon:yes gene_type:complete